MQLFTFACCIHGVMLFVPSQLIGGCVFLYRTTDYDVGKFSVVFKMLIQQSQNQSILTVGVLLFPYLLMIGR